MTDRSLEELLEDEEDAIVVAVRERMRGDESVGRVATQRQIREGDLLAQVTGFWFQAMRSDIALGFCDSMRQSLSWLVSFRSGHQLPFGDDLVGRMFEDISEEIEARLETDGQRRQYIAYRDEVRGIIAETFPG